jgi:hypothetical protein
VIDGPALPGHGVAERIEAILTNAIVVATRSDGRPHVNRTALLGQQPVLRHDATEREIVAQSVAPAVVT